MANVTIAVAAALIALGVGTKLGTGTHSPTALIPAGFGVVLLVCGLLARTDDARRRMVVMHVAVLVGLLGFLGSVRGLYKVAELLAGQSVVRPTAQEAQAAMAVLTGVYVALCVRSFVNARRNRAPEAAGD